MRQIDFTLKEIAKLLPRRSDDVHKHSIGRVLVIAGSRGMSGAALLASRSVLRAGAGVVSLAVPAYLTDLVDVENIEVMTLPLLYEESGNISIKAAEKIIPVLKEFDVILIGPGLSAFDSTVFFVRNILEFISKEASFLKVVIDADALRGLKKIVRPLQMPTIITPHFGELSRLLGRSVNEIKAAPAAAAYLAAQKYNVTVVLKSHQTYLVEPSAVAYFVSAIGNPGMATAGCGDVLAGLLAGLLAANKISVLRAAIAAVTVHSLAGNRAALNRSQDGIIASDILENIPQALKQLKGV